MSKSKSSELVRGAGMAATLWQKYEEAVKRNHGTDEDLHLLAQPAGDSFINKIAKDLVAFGAMQRNAYVVPVNYDLTHREQIEEAKFNWITDYDNYLIVNNPTEHLYLLPTGQMNKRITLVHLNRSAERKEIIAEMDKFNVRPVLSPEFLAFIKAYPDLQRHFPLVCLGSVWVGSHGDRDVLYTCENPVRRSLRLHSGDAEWDEACRFPAVCKEITP